MQFWEGKLNKFFYSLGVKTDLNLSELIGAKITDVGFHPSAQEGGFSIDYECNDKINRVVLGFTELGMWVVWHGEINNPTELDLLKQKISKFIESDDFGTARIEYDLEQKRYKFINDLEDEVFSLTSGDLKLLPTLNLRLYDMYDNDLDYYADEIYEYLNTI